MNTMTVLNGWWCSTKTQDKGKMMKISRASLLLSNLSTRSWRLSKTVRKSCKTKGEKLRICSWPKSKTSGQISNKRRTKFMLSKITTSPRNVQNIEHKSVRSKRSLLVWVLRWSMSTSKRRTLIWNKENIQLLVNSNCRSNHTSCFGICMHNTPKSIYLLGRKVFWRSSFLKKLSQITSRCWKMLIGLQEILRLLKFRKLKKWLLTWPKSWQISNHIFLSLELFATQDSKLGILIK